MRKSLQERESEMKVKNALAAFDARHAPRGPREIPKGTSREKRQAFYEARASWREHGLTLTWEQWTKHLSLSPK